MICTEDLDIIRLGGVGDPEGIGADVIVSVCPSCERMELAATSHYCIFCQ